MTRTRDDELLIYDVGMHNGDDTAYYLHKGARVVAVEANPEQVRRAETRFAEPIAAGRLKILAVGIAETSGEQEFYVSTKESAWSSFDRGNATKNGSGCRSVRVRCVTFGEVLAEQGVPDYLKIDIEGNDRLCLDALTPDRRSGYLSIEMSHPAGDRDLRALGDLGYAGFQCIRQNDFASITPENVEGQIARRRRLSRPGPVAASLRVLRRFLDKRFGRRDGSWAFPPGASGRIGRDLPGPWMPLDEALDVWRALRDADRELSAGGLGEWFDIHARAPEARP
jgi:FkbM family methyltransferase